MIFEHLDKEYNVDQIRKEYEDMDNRSNFSVEPGEYTAILENLETKITSTGKPMITVTFKLNSHNYYYNFVIHDGRGLYYYIRFLKQLVGTEDRDQWKRITFEGYEQLEQLTGNILRKVHQMPYRIRIGKSKNNYDTLEIIE